MDGQRGYRAFPRSLVTDTHRTAELVGLLLPAPPAGAVSQQ